MKYLNAILIIEIPGEKRSGKKYHNIPNNSNGITKFLKFAVKIPFATHVNFYHKGSKEFFKQIRLDEKSLSEYFW